MASIVDDNTTPVLGSIKNAVEEEMDRELYASDSGIINIPGTCQFVDWDSMKEFEEEKKAEQQELDLYLETETESFEEDSSYVRDSYDFYDLSSFNDNERDSFCEDEAEDKAEAGYKPEAKDEPQEIVQEKSQVEPQAEPKYDVGIETEAF